MMDEAGAIRVTFEEVRRMNETPKAINVCAFDEAAQLILRPATKRLLMFHQTLLPD